MQERTPPSALPHGELRELFRDVFFVTGTVKMPGKPMTFSRNMVVIREGEDLILVNSLRLDDHGLRALEKLGKVRAVLRIAGFHGIDDAFYKQRYGAKVYALKGHIYVEGFDPNAEPYFDADEYIDAASDLPVSGARLYLYKSAKPAEAVLLLLREGGILISGDSLQNWSTPDRYFNLMGRLMMRIMGFIKPYNIGPAWKKFTKPSAADLRGILDLRFENLLPAHGDEVIGDAKTHFRAAIEKAASTAT